MNSYKIREYKGREDLVRMQELVSSQFNIRSDLHIGDIAWQRFQHEGTGQEWPTYLLEEDGKLVAWGWLDSTDQLMLAVHPSHPAATGLLIRKLSESRSSGRMSVEIFESEDHIISNLLNLGFKEVKDGPFYLRMAIDLGNLQEVKHPEGFNIRSIDTKSDLERRVDVHREAFHPSRVTYKSYGNVMNSPGYRSDLDWVAVAQDGTFASYCLIWYDKNSKTGLLEPVGTSPKFRKLGLSKAVCTSALMELKRMGGKGAIVNSRGDKERPIPNILYRSIGFKEISRNRTFFKEY